jgi:hypothetical protein
VALEVAEGASRLQAGNGAFHPELVGEKMHDALGDLGRR